MPKPILGPAPPSGPSGAVPSQAPPTLPPPPPRPMPAPLPPPPQVGACKIPLALCLKNACLPGSCSCACFALQAPCHVGLKALCFTTLQQQGTSSRAPASGHGEF